MWNVLARQRHGLSGLRIAAGTRRTVVQREAAETADFDAVAIGERAPHHLQQRFHREVDIVGLQVPLALGEDFDELGLGHVALLAPDDRSGLARARPPRMPRSLLGLP